MSGYWSRDPAPPLAPPLTAALSLLALWSGVTLFGPWPPPVPQVLMAAVLGLAAWRWPAAALGRPLPGTRRLMILPWLALTPFPLLILALGGPPPLPVLLWLALLMALVALSEELMFRGLLFPALRRHLAPGAAILLTTLAFALIHLPAQLMAGNPAGALVQVLAALPTGLLLLALRLRRGSLRPAILYHWLWNLGAFSLATTEQLTASPLPPVLPLLLVMPNGLCALWLLRGPGRPPARPGPW